MIADNVTSILRENRAFAKKQYGQNFLKDKNVLQKIIDMSSISKEDIVIEIGPGIGCLTEFLAINAKKVICYEIDEIMVKILEKTLEKYTNVEIIKGDFLKADLSRYHHLQESNNIKVVANLPYYITSPIIFKLLKETKINQFTLMVQKEVAQRFVGKPNTKDYNALSVVIQLKANASIEYIVKPNSFFPSPNVESALLLMRMKKNDCRLKNEADFVKFVQTIFTQRRKNLLNNLCGYKGLNKSALMTIFEDASINSNTRAENLSIEEIIALYEHIINQQ